MIECSFCGKQASEVAAMVSGPEGLHICDECVATCAEAMMRDLGLKMQAERDGSLVFMDEGDTLLDFNGTV